MTFFILKTHRDLRMHEIVSYGVLLMHAHFHQVDAALRFRHHYY